MKKLFMSMLILCMSSPAFSDELGVDDIGTLEKEKKITQFTSDLGLSTDQQNKLRASRDKFKPQIDEKLSNFKSANEKFSNAVKDPKTSVNDLQSLFQKRLDAANALQLVNFQSRMDFRNILTETQRAKLATSKEINKDKKDSEAEEDAKGTLDQ